MDCLVSPAASILRRRGSTGSRLMSYRPLPEEHDDDDGVDCSGLRQVTVVVGKEKRQFLVDSFTLDEGPFRALIDKAEAAAVAAEDRSGKEKPKKKKKRKRGSRQDDVIFVDVDSILFEHMLWLMRNDSRSLFQLNLEEIIDFYSLDY